MCLHTRSLCDESADSNFNGEDEVTSLAWSLDGNYLKLLVTYRGHFSEAWDVSGSPDGKLIASVVGGHSTAMECDHRKADHAVSHMMSLRRG